MSSVTITARPSTTSLFNAALGDEGEWADVLCAYATITVGNKTVSGDILNPDDYDSLDAWVDGDILALDAQIPRLDFIAQLKEAYLAAAAGREFNFTTDFDADAANKVLLEAGFEALECLDPETGWQVSYPANPAKPAFWGVCTSDSAVDKDGEHEWTLCDGETGLVDEDALPTTLTRAIEEARRRNG